MGKDRIAFIFKSLGPKIGYLHFVYNYSMNYAQSQDVLNDMIGSNSLKNIDSAIL